MADRKQPSPRASKPRDTSGEGSTVRVLIGLSGSLPFARVSAELKRLDVIAAAPAPELPDVAIATLPATRATDSLLQQLQQLDGVAFAERDSFRQTL